jgi:hypothetical protein
MLRKNRIRMQRAATMAKFGVPMPLQTHLRDNQPTGNRFYWHHCTIDNRYQTVPTFAAGLHTRLK